MSARCLDVLDALPGFVGGDLDAERTESVRQHLIACHTCRAQAAGLQQAASGLRRAAVSAPAGVDDAMFAAMHAAIMARVDELEAVPAAPTTRRYWGVSAAAAALIGLGFWCGHRALGPDASEELFRRPPMATPAAFDEPKVVPYSGPRATMRQLGNDAVVEELVPPTDSSGMRGRDALRSLVDEGMVLPRRIKPPSPPAPEPR